MFKIFKIRISTIMKISLTSHVGQSFITPAIEYYAILCYTVTLIIDRVWSDL